jgi:stage II sporulation protein P
MLVVGTDYAGAPHGEWEDNLSFALKLQKSTLGVNAGLMRSINLRSASFNAQYAKGAVLVEIGAAGNTLDEAKRAGELFADGVADVICGDG